jgi:DNA-binding response OmpR family regulator
MQTVLILDIDEATNELYRRELGRCYHVIACTTETEAWHIVQQGVNAIVLEPAALEDEAWSFVTRLRAAEQYCRVPIIVCSTLDARHRGAEVGATAYLIKPVSPNLLSLTIRTVLHSARQLTP